MGLTLAVGVSSVLVNWSEVNMSVLVSTDRLFDALSDIRVISSSFAWSREY